MNKLKAVQKYRMRWDKDIPICTGFEYQYSTEWRDIPWKKLERRVHKLQKRIYQACQRGDIKAVRRLQKTLIRSWSAKCLAVRRGKNSFKKPTYFSLNLLTSDEIELY
ncbi:reverse transcriptase N-terminal domain-containing protein [Microseira wollei]|uniref:Reverse transcriptase homolog n=1 Tax=Microseira wollei NIES-4236 TaxID=2530354 RepID=A0AAV3X9A5_9CYAN|nr:reverse transcriptase N-terminal domain-containing protein [Microseira wollei]GET38420.1 reverse transcriptase homolog [Microseira wollei NIES-4236]